MARGDVGAMSMLAVADADSIPRLPNMYMRKMSVGPTARGNIDLTRSIGDNVRAIAEAFERNPEDITAIVLDRPRHEDLIEEIRQAGARIKLIPDGDVTASVSAAIRGTNDHLAIGIGGARQAVISAAALRCLGGELQAQLWPVTRTEIDQAAEHGIDDVQRVFTTDDLAPGEMIVAATGVSNSDLLRGVQYLARQRAHAFDGHVHEPQLGEVRGRHPLLRARPARGSSALVDWGRADSRADHRRPARRRGPGARAWTSSSWASSTTSRSTDAKVKVTYSLTSMGCPVGPMIEQEIRETVASMDGVDETEAELTWEPPWSPDKMSDDAKFMLGFG